LIKNDETVVAVLTGHVLKDTDYAMKYHGDSLIAPDGARITGTFANVPIRTVNCRRQDLHFHTPLRTGRLDSGLGVSG